MIQILTFFSLKLNNDDTVKVGTILKNPSEYFFRSDCIYLSIIFGETISYFLLYETSNDIIYNIFNKMLPI